MRKKRAKKDEKEAVSGGTKERPKSEPKEKAEPAFQFGLINVLLIFGLGAIVCNQCARTPTAANVT